MKGARIVLLEEHRAELERYLFDEPRVEGAAFLLCGQARTETSERLISHKVVPIAKEDYARRAFDGLSLTSQALSRITKLARHEGLSIIFAHSHPGGFADFSEQDDREEDRLQPFLRARVPDRLHGTLVLTKEAIVGRVYAPHRISADVLIVGKRFRLHTPYDHRPVPAVFDRQVRAFGPEVQNILSRLHVGVVGLGGIGSPVAEQLYRLGVGNLTLIDGDVFEATNVNRIYGSTLADVGTPKVEIAKRHLDRIGLETQVHSVPIPITRERAALVLRNSDVIFGCTDKQAPRAILTQIALKYNLPVFDLGVLIDSKAGSIRGVYGRVTTLAPGEACLFCRGRITADAIRVETLSPADRASQIRQGYAPELAQPAPAVVAFTSGVASFGVAELLHRLTGFMGTDRESSELLITFDESRIRSNRVERRDTCLCADRTIWGRGDETPFLGMSWQTCTI